MERLLSPSTQARLQPLADAIKEVLRRDQDRANNPHLKAWQIAPALEEVAMMAHLDHRWDPARYTGEFRAAHRNDIIRIDLVTARFEALRKKQGARVAAQTAAKLWAKRLTRIPVKRVQFVQPWEEVIGDALIRALRLALKRHLKFSYPSSEARAKGAEGRFSGPDLRVLAAAFDLALKIPGAPPPQLYRRRKPGTEQWFASRIRTQFQKPL